MSSLGQRMTVNRNGSKAIKLLQMSTASTKVEKIV